MVDLQASCKKLKRHIFSSILSSLQNVWHFKCGWKYIDKSYERQTTIFGSNNFRYQQFQVPTVSGSQSSYFSKSGSIDSSVPSKGSNNPLSAHSTSSISKSLLDSVMVITFVAHTEICWALKIALLKYSKISCDIGQLFKVLLPDSKAAESFSCAKTKSKYIIAYGVAPYFLQCLQDELNVIPIISYDESFNRVLHFDQMDFLIRF